jgi:hypothetical protein
VSVVDYRINAEVRRHLVSRWVDVSRLQLGTTNGVVYVMGFLDTTMEDPGRRLDEMEQRHPGARALQLAMRLDRDLRRLPDIRDVVFKLENVFKRGGRWRTMDGSNFGSHVRSSGSRHASVAGGSSRRPGA